MDEDRFWKILDVLNIEAHKETENMKQCVKELVPTYTIDGQSTEKLLYAEHTKENEARTERA